MKGNRKTLISCICLIAFAAMDAASGLTWADDATVTGTVSSEGILEADDGANYVINADEKGDSLIKEAGKKVKVVGAVEEKEGKKVITVSNYEKVE